MRTRFCIFLSSLLVLSLCAVSVRGQTPTGERKVLTINGIEYAFRWCPSGNFMMGNEPGEVSVTLSRSFWMLETQVTQAMWKSVMGGLKNGAGEDLEGYFVVVDGAKEAKIQDCPEFLGDKKPIVCVSWNDSQEYIKKLNDMGVAPKGFKFSLPTEAQWEYACRAGTTTAYSFGDTLTQQQANFGGDQTKEVGSYPANAWGLRDMHGNVWEWCQDWSGNYPGGAVTDPMGADRGSYRVIRGGGWADFAQACRSAFRSYYDPSLRSIDLGLRLSLVSQ